MHMVGTTNRPTSTSTPVSEWLPQFAAGVRSAVSTIGALARRRRWRWWRRARRNPTVLFIATVTSLSIVPCYLVRARPGPPLPAAGRGRSPRGDKAAGGG
eukprot:SAG31_NODE_436_length_15717_cov_5.420412_7_plen_100_part_00